MSKFLTVDFSLQDCKVYKFISNFKRSFGICKAVCKQSIWFVFSNLDANQVFVYKHAWEYRNKVLNFEANLQMPKQSSEHYSLKLTQISCGNYFVTTIKMRSHCIGSFQKRSIPPRKKLTIPLLWTSYTNLRHSLHNSLPPSQMAEISSVGAAWNFYGTTHFVFLRKSRTL